MRNKLQLLLVLALLLLMGRFIIISGSQKLQLEVSEDDNLSILLTTNYRQQRIYPWYNVSDSRYYFFLPAFGKSNIINLHSMNRSKTLLLNDMSVQSGNKFKLQEEMIYQLKIQTENTVVSYDIIFLCSENLPAIFIETDSGSMEYLHQNKENEEKGNINIVTADGNLEYSGILAKISGRGNSTWNQEKKPYSIELKEEKPLLGMERGDKWCLLAGWYEGAKLNTKIGFDISEAIGLAGPQCVWVDLYLNGEYAGIYYLTEPVSIGKRYINIKNLEKENKANNYHIDGAETFERNGMKGYLLNNGASDITGGYLIEKDFYEYWRKSESGFITSRGNAFTINSPKHASEEQVEYIFQYIQKIEDIISSGGTEYKEHIDFTSFVKKFIVDEIALSHDVNTTSMYYYKEKAEDLLYAGPVWDFDNAFGESNSGWTDGHWVDYTWSIIYSLRDEEELDWYAKLYEDDLFRTQVIETYEEFLPYMEEILEVKIDEYAAWIEKSVQLDKVRWQNVSISQGSPGHYIDFYNNVRYLKFFLANRLNYLNERWNISYRDFLPPVNVERHEVVFYLDGEAIETREIQDGQTLDLLPDLDEEVYLGWYYSYNDEKYRNQLPIYENTSLYARQKQ